MSRAEQNEYERLTAAARRLGVSRWTLRRWVDERADFPRPIRLSDRVTVFLRADIDYWVRRQAEARNRTAAP